MGRRKSPQYLSGVLAAADLAKKCGINAIYVIEFGVARGNGLLALQDYAAMVEKVGSESRAGRRRPTKASLQVRRMLDCVYRLGVGMSNAVVVWPAGAKQSRPIPAREPADSRLNPKAAPALVVYRDPVHIVGRCLPGQICAAIK